MNSALENVFVTECRYIVLFSFVEHWVKIVEMSVLYCISEALLLRAGKFFALISTLVYYNEMYIEYEVCYNAYAAVHLIDFKVVKK